MKAYIDRVLFVKAFVLETNSAETIRLLEEIGEPFAYSHLHEVEIPKAIRSFQADVDAGRFARIAYDLAAVFMRAEQLSAKCSAGIDCRSLDL